MEEKFKDLYKQIEEIQQKIIDRKECRDNVILEHGTQIFVELDRDLKDKLNAIDKAFPFKEMCKLLGVWDFRGTQSLFGRDFMLEINLKDKKRITYAFYGSKNATYAETFIPVVTKTRIFQDTGYTLSTEKYETFFKDENPYAFFTEMFNIAIKKLFNALKDKLEKLEKDYSKITIPSFDFMRAKDEAPKPAEDNVVIGEYGKYKVVLQRK